MKKFILLMLTGLTAFAYGQNVTENRVSFTFIQLPTNPIDTKYKTYNIRVEPKFEQANEDSLSNYSLRLDEATQQYEAQMVAWRERVKVMKKDYLGKMAYWQKEQNKGNLINQPVEPAYPVQPAINEIPYPHLHSDLDQERVNQAIQLAGFDKGDGGAMITIGVLPISDIDIKMNVKKSSSETIPTKYEYRAYYKLPLEVKVEDPSSGIVLQTILLNTVRSYELATYQSQYDYEIWWLDNREKFWMDLEKKGRNIALKEANDFINNKCGYPQKSRVSEVYTIKRFKDFQYNDLVNAYTAAQQGYRLVGQTRNRQEAHSKLKDAIKIWKTALKESNLNERKTRINDKVTAMLHCNIAEAYIWMSNFAEAEKHINLAISINVNKFERAAKGLKGLLQERKMRWNTNY